MSSKINSPKAFKFTGKIANAEQKLKATYDEEWNNIKKSGGKLWRIPLIINTVIVAVISVILISAMCFGIAIFINDEALSFLVDTSPSDVILIVVLGFIQIYVPWRIAMKGALK